MRHPKLEPNYNLLATITVAVAFWMVAVWLSSLWLTGLSKWVDNRNMTFAEALRERAIERGAYHENN